MSSQLDILRDEPFFGAAQAHARNDDPLQQASLDAAQLPTKNGTATRRGRALVAELLTRHWSGRFDVLFTSEAMNLADLYRSCPVREKTVVVFSPTAINARRETPSIDQAISPSSPQHRRAANESGSTRCITFASFHSRFRRWCSGIPSFPRTIRCRVNRKAR